MKKLIHAHTDTKAAAYPGYINVSGNAESVDITVRSGGGAGVNRGSFITLTRAELIEIHTAIAKYLIDTEPTPAPTPIAKYLIDTEPTPAPTPTKGK